MSHMWQKALMKNCPQLLKRNVAGKALPKQQKATGTVAIPNLLNSGTNPWDEVYIPDGPFVASKGRGRKKGKKSGKKASRSALKEHVKRYDIIAKLAYDPSGLTFGQLLRGDAELPKKEINRLFSRQTGGRQSFAGHAEIRQRRLRLVNIQVYGTKAQGLLDTGAVPNIMSSPIDAEVILLTRRHFQTHHCGKRKECRVFRSVTRSACLPWRID